MGKQKNKLKEATKQTKKTKWATLKELNESGNYPELLTRSQLQQLVKVENLKTKKLGRARKYAIDGLDIHYKVIKQSNSKIGTYTRGSRKYIDVLQTTQAFVGGSTSNAKWTGEFKNNYWGTEKSHKANYIKENAFFDTVIIAVPVIVIVSESTQFKGGIAYVKTDESNRLAINALKKLLKNKVDNSNMLIDANQSHLGLTVSDLTLQKAQKGCKIDATTTHTKISKWGGCSPKSNHKIGEKYIAYQNLILGCSDTRIDIMYNFIKQQLISPQLLHNHPITILRFDITTNVQGAVRQLEDRIDLSEHGLTIKENRRYVGDTTHSYIALPNVKVLNKKAIEGDTSRVDSYPAGISSLFNKIQEIETHNMDLLVENLDQKELVETKIYDKLKYMLEVSTITSQTTSSRSLTNLAHSSKKEIDTAFTNFFESGVSRIETRFRGGACFLELEDLMLIHATFAPILVKNYSIKTSFEDSVNSLLSTVKATVCMVVRSQNGNANDWYGLAYWTNSLTKKIQGRTSKMSDNRDRLEGLTASDYLLWKQYQSDRYLPLIEIEYESIPNASDTLDKSAIKLLNVTVYPPTSVGFSNIIQIKEGSVSKAKSAGKAFYSRAKMGCFRASKINAKSPRNLLDGKDFQTITEAKQACVEIRKQFNRRLKIESLQENSEPQDVVALFFKQDIKELKAKTLRLKREGASESGYLVTRDNKRFIIRRSKAINSKTGLIVFKLHHKSTVNVFEYKNELVQALAVERNGGITTIINRL